MLVQDKSAFTLEHSEITASTFRLWLAPLGGRQVPAAISLSSHRRTRVRSVCRVLPAASLCHRLLASSRRAASPAASPARRVAACSAAATASLQRSRAEPSCSLAAAVDPRQSNPAPAAARRAAARRARVLPFYRAPA